MVLDMDPEETFGLFPLVRRCMDAFELVLDKLVVDRFRPGTEGPEGGWPETRVTTLPSAVCTCPDE